MNLLKKLFFSILLLICGFPVSGQTEVNVLIRSSEAPLRAFFRSQLSGNMQRAAVTPVLASAYPFLMQLDRVRALAPETHNSGLENWFTLKPDSQDADAFVRDLLQSGAFESVEINRSRQLHHIEREADWVPNDPELSEQYYHGLIRSFQAWDISRGSKQIRIGILDTGLDFGHPEFAGQVWINGPEDLNGNNKLDPWPNSEVKNGIPGDFDGLDNDGNGYVDDVAGFDFTDQPTSPFGGDYLFEDGNPADENGHGTVVAGIAAARADNMIGGAGVAPDCELVIIRAFSASGIGEDDDISRAIIYAADNGVPVLNFSFGDIYPSLMMHAAIQYAYQQGVIMASSSGNGTGDELHYPSGFNEVISVSASAYDPASGDEFLWPLSSYGVTVDLAAPGSGILAPVLRDTTPDGEPVLFGSFSGTSASAPMVAGAAALLLSEKGNLTPQQIRGILTTTADDISETGWDHLTGAGRLNIYRALRAGGASHVAISSPVNDGGSAASSVAITGTALDPAFRDYSLEWQAGVEDIGPWNPIISGIPYQALSDTLGTWDLDGLPEGDYTLRLRVEKSDGFTIEDRIRFVRDLSPPEIEISLAAPCWDNQLRKVLILFRSSDQGMHTLHFRRTGTSAYAQLPFDRSTRNGEFLLGTESLTAADYEIFISSTNLAGLTANSPTETFSFSPASVYRDGFKSLDISLPMGAYLPRTYDFDQDGLREVVMSDYGGQLSFGRLKIYEYNAGGFSLADSLSFKKVLIPKDVQDANQNGLLELLCSVNDSSYIVEQAAPGEYPSKIIYTNEDNGLFPARFGDTNGNGTSEILFKDFQDYFVYAPDGGGGYTESAVLPDVSAGYIGSIAPKALVDDFDQDGRTDVVFGDFDGDLMVYEHTGGNQYALAFLDTTALTKSGAYLVQGDFDGDSSPEFFVAAHTSSLRNADFEYDSPYWWLRIFKSTGDNTYSVVWEDYLYDLDTEGYNGATAGNLDTDAGDEILFTTFPRTYMIDFENGEYKMAWFIYGTLATTHVIGDFNGNGVNEFALGRGDTAFLYERDIQYGGPGRVTSMRGRVLGSDSTLIEWDPAPGATEYLVYRGEVVPGGVLVGLVGVTTTQRRFRDLNATQGPDYLYTIRTVNPALTPDTSDFGSFVVLRPHPPARIDSLRASGDRQLQIFFSAPVVDRMEDKALFRVNGRPAIAVIQAGYPANRLLLTFAEAFSEGVNTLETDSLFLDAWLGRLDAGSRIRTFLYEKEEEDYLFLTHWASESDKLATMGFNYALSDNALDTANYAISPLGRIEKIEWANDEKTEVRVRIRDANFGALGNPLSITVTDVVAQNGTVILDNEGNTATFASFKEDLSEVFVYPNPVRPNPYFDGLRFANLTRTATIQVMNLSGRRVNELEETDGDGGYEWNMRDEGGNRIKPGIYLFRVSSEGVEDFVGKFSVVE